MIGLETDRRVLARFVRELETQSPLENAFVPPDLSAYTAEEIDAARFTWGLRVVDEYRSVVVFSELLALLADVSAGFPALCAVQRLIGDELRHAQLCARMAEALGGDRALRLDLEGLGLPPSDRPRAAFAYEVVVRELVVAEGESLAVIRAFRDAVTDPATKRVFEILLVDEARHFVTGRQLASHLEELFGDELSSVREELPAIIAEDRRHIRGAYLRGATAGPGRALGASLRPEDLRPLE
jgi:hypothetical protein